MGSVGNILVGVVVAVVVVMVAAVTVRRIEHEVGVWHVDPLTAPKPPTPNSYRVAPADAATEKDAVAPVYSMPVSDLAAAFDRVARASARVDVVGGSPADRFVTYVQTSALFGFPDYISVRFIELDGDRSTFAVFSRSRLGRGDLGVNRKRVESWLAQLG